MESNAQQTSQGKAVVAVFAAVLERLVKSNSQVSNTENVTKFHALKAPAISIKHYLERIHKYASCSTECFILALIYIDRLIQRNNFILTELNVHRVCITAILLAAKFFDDAYYNNAYYAKVGGVLVSEMNGLEVEFLFRINFSLHVTPELFIKYQDELISHAIGAGLERPAEVVPVSSCAHPVTPPPSTPKPVEVPMPGAATVSLHCPSVENPCYSNCDWNVQSQRRNVHEEICVPNKSIDCGQIPWNGTVQSGPTFSEVNQQRQVVTRHISPSPPDYQHHQQNQLDPNKISPAHSAPGALIANNRSNLSSNTNSYLPLHNHSTRNTRPRYNSYPAESFNAVNLDMTIHQEQKFHSTQTHHYSAKTRIHGPVEVFPCSHFGRQMDAKSTSPHLVSATRGVYQ